MGWRVEFETKFQQVSTNGPHDIDLSAWDTQGNAVHLEVYMPHKTSDVQGCFDPAQDNHAFEARVKHKLMIKFGQQGFTGLNGQVLLAVNTAFFDLLRVQELLSPVSVNYQSLLQHLPPQLNGLLLFADGFESDAFFRLIGLLLP